MSTAPPTSEANEVRATSAKYTVAVALVAAVGGLMFGYDIGVIADAETFATTQVIGVAH